MARRNAFDQLVDDLGDRYSWPRLTPGPIGQLYKAAKGKTRAAVMTAAKDLADDLERSPSATELARQLRTLDTEPATPKPASTPPPTGMTFHPLDCQCGGTGVIRELDGLAMTDDHGVVISDKRADLVTPCRAHGGRRMTAEQFERYQTEARARELANPTEGTPPGILEARARARAHLNGDDAA